MAKNNFRQEFTDKIIQALKDGTAPWQKPWDADAIQSLMPYNPISGTQYRGANQLGLMLSGYDDPRWCTYKQAAAEGWQVRKGETSTTIEFWKWSDEREEVDPISQEKKTVIVKRETPMVRYASVFNAAQMDNVPELTAPTKKYEWEPLEQAEKIVQNSEAKIIFVEQDRAFYSSQQDLIKLPPREAFATASKFYAVALHEIGHSTGHETRLNRKLGNVFGSEDYAKEELRAELASFFLSAKLGIEYDLGNHASYIGSWINALASDHNEIFKASRDAERISEYVMDFGLEKSLRKNVEQVAEKTVSIGEIKAADSIADTAAFPTSEKSNVSTVKTFINVKYAEKEEAKALGAEWDKTQKSWFIPAGKNQTPFDKWRADQPLAVGESKFKEAFLTALLDAKLIIDGMPIMDGEWHHVPVSTSSSTKALKGAYRGNLSSDGLFADGYIKNHDANDYSGPWKPTDLNLTEAEVEQYRQNMLANTAERANKLKSEQEAVSAKCTEQWNKLPWVETHPYLERKGITGEGLKVQGTKLVVPVQDQDGKIWSLQYIPADEGAQKLFETGGKKTGNFMILGDLKSSDTVLFAEGLATGKSLRAATNLPVVVTFDSGNIHPVIEALKDLTANHTKLICGDDDVVDDRKVIEWLRKQVAGKQNEKLELKNIEASDIVFDGSKKQMSGNSDCVISMKIIENVPGVGRVFGQIENASTQSTMSITVSNGGRESATKISILENIPTVFPQFGDYHGHRTDFNDLHLSEGLYRIKDQIDTALTQFHEREALKAVPAGVEIKEPRNNSTYVGKVIANTPEHTLQDLGKATAIKHQNEKLDRIPSAGVSTKISYTKGLGKVVDIAKDKSVDIVR